MRGVDQQKELKRLLVQVVEVCSEVNRDISNLKTQISDVQLRINVLEKSHKSTRARTTILLAAGSALMLLPVWVFGSKSPQQSVSSASENTTNVMFGGIKLVSGSSPNPLELALDPEKARAGDWDRLSDNGGLNRYSKFHGAEVRTATATYIGPGGRVNYIELNISVSTSRNELRNLVDKVYGRMTWEQNRLNSKLWSGENKDWKVYGEENGPLYHITMFRK
ncbi:hypothetical protein [Azospirillum himalayense]|uniref:Uncharacterized protein n=1 Tax=Azospirillum himalayense TaxID=654847 RepID=A0ABW0G0E3_9PROT